MASSLCVSGRVVERSRNSVRFEMRLGNPSGLKRNEEVQGAEFGVAGLKWTLVITRKVAYGGDEQLMFFVISPNSQGVTADVALTVANPTSGKKVPFAAKKKVACPRTVMERRAISISDLTNSNNGFQADDEIVVDVSVKGVKDAGDEEQGRTRQDLWNITLEIIDAESIEEWLKKGNVFGLASAVRTRNSDLAACSLVSCWERSSLDRRHWLCGRSRDGNVSVEKPVGRISLLDRFTDIAEPDELGCPWVTLFKEKKKSSGSFEELGGNTIIVFCKFFEPPYQELSYLGHLFAETTTPCQHLLARIVYDLAQIPDGVMHNAYVEKVGQQIEEITSCRESLHECGIRMGSTIILRKRQGDQCTSARVVERVLQLIHRGESENQAEAGRGGGLAHAMTVNGEITLSNQMRIAGAGSPAQ